MTIKFLNFYRLTPASILSAIIILINIYGSKAFADRQHKNYRAVSFAEFICPQLTSADFIAVGLPSLRHRTSTDGGKTCIYELLEPGTYHYPTAITSTFTIEYKKFGSFTYNSPVHIHIDRQDLVMEFYETQIKKYQAGVIYTKISPNNPDSYPGTVGVNNVVETIGKNNKALIIFRYNQVTEMSKLSSSSVILLASSLLP